MLSHQIKKPVTNLIKVIDAAKIYLRNSTSKCCRKNFRLFARLCKLTLILLKIQTIKHHEKL